MRIYVHVKEKIVLVQCGEGNQKLKWLGHVGIARYDSNIELGIPISINREDGTVLDMNENINKILKDDQHIIVKVNT